MKRSNSEILIREIYPPTMQIEANEMSGELEKILNEKTKTDKRYLGSVVCASIFIFFLILFSITFIFVIIPVIIIGACLGNALGRRWKRQKFQQSSMPQEKKYVYKLSAILRYLRNLKKAEISLVEFQAILEKAFEAYLPGLIIQINDVKVAKEIKSLVNFLKSNSVHGCMLNAAALLEDSISHNENPAINARRLRKFFIPVMNLLKKPVGKENEELEVVRKIVDIMSKEETHIILLTFTMNSDDIVNNISPFSYLYSINQDNYQVCKAISDIDSICNPSIPKVAPTLRLYRRNSCSELISSPECDKKRIVIKSLTKAHQDFKYTPVFQENEVSVSKFEPLSPKKLYFNSPSKLQISESPNPLSLKKPVQSIFLGGIKDLHISSDDSDLSLDDIPDKSDSNEESPLKHNLLHDNALNIDFDAEVFELYEDKVHPFIDCFDLLLNIEIEPFSDKIWKQVVDRPETKVFQKKAGDSPICMIKAFCDVKYPAMTVYKAIWDTEVRTKWDTLFNEFRVIDVQKDYEVLYYMIKTPFGISKRDWVQRRIQIFDYPDPGNIILHFVSMEHPAMPPKKGAIRAETLISGYIIRPTSEKTCKVTIISQNDIKGLIPKSIVNSIASKAPVEWVNTMNKGCKLVSGY
jgi:START domain